MCVKVHVPLTVFQTQDRAKSLMSLMISSLLLHQPDLNLISFTKKELLLLVLLHCANVPRP